MIKDARGVIKPGTKTSRLTGYMLDKIPFYRMKISFKKQPLTEILNPRSKHFFETDFFRSGEGTFDGYLKTLSSDKVEFSKLNIK